jgi:DNA helicase II / ATP-dependent DNA helicase PcrA
MVKGLGFERVLIIPYGGITKWLRTGDSEHVAGSADEVYVGVTRAQSVAFIHDGDVAVPGISVFQP